MLTLPFKMTSLIIASAPLFSKPVWCHVQMLLVGVILAPGKRTITSALRVMGLSHERHFQPYHRVLNRERWSSLVASRLLLSLLIKNNAPALGSTEPKPQCRLLNCYPMSRERGAEPSSLLIDVTS